MNKRMLDGNIWANEKFSDMPPMACLLQIGLINLADDQGRMKAHPLYLRSQIFPYRDVTVDEVSMWLSHIIANGTALAYQVDGKDYLQLVNWWQYQSHSFAQPSDYPRPDGWQDRIRYTGKNRTIFTCNWAISSGEILEDTCDQDGHPLQKPNKPHGTPPSQPLAQPPGQPVTPLIEDKDKDKEEDKEEEEAEGAAPPAAAADYDPDVARIWAKWDANMPGVRTEVITNSVNSLLDDYSAAEIEEAISIACKRNRRNLSYIQGILAKGVFSETPANGNGYSGGKPSGLDVFKEYARKNGVAI